MQVGEEAARIREQLGVPAVTGPPRAVLQIDVDLVPVHVEHRDRERNAFGREAVHQVEVLLGAVGVVAAPPVAEREAGQQRLRPGQSVQRADRRAVVGAVGEHVQVLASGFARCDPAVIGEQHGARVVDHCDAGAREHAGLERARAVDVVEGARRTAEVGEVGPVAPQPSPTLDAVPGLHGQSLGAEGLFVIDQVEPGGADLELAGAVDDLELTGLEGAVERDLRRAVLEGAGLAVLEPEQPVGQDGDAVVRPGHDVLGTGERLHVGATGHRAEPSERTS